jgi:predicted porin
MTLKYKLLLVALAIACSSPAMAVKVASWGEGNTLEIFGRVQLAYEYLNTGSTYATFAGSGVPCNQCTPPGKTLNGGGAATLSAGWNSPFVSQESPSHDRLRNQRSTIGFRGTVKIDDDLKAVFQVESSAAADGGGGLHVPEQTWANRDSGVGIESKKWGRLLFGNWQTPYTHSTFGYDPYYTNTGAYMGVMGNGSGASMDPLSDNATFDRREHNLIQWWSPDWNGFKFRLGYEAGESKIGVNSFNYPGGNPTFGNNGSSIGSCPNVVIFSDPTYTGADAVTPNPAGPGVVVSGKTYTRCTGSNPHLMSLESTYEKGPLNATLAYERHQNFNSNGSDYGVKAGIAYWYADTVRLAAIVQRLSYKVFDGTLYQNQFYVSSVYKFDEINSFKLGYARGGEVGGTSHVIIGFLRAGPESASSILTLGPEHKFNKNFAVWAYWSKTFNEKNAFMDFPINDTTPSTGSSPSVVAVGMRATF